MNISIIGASAGIGLETVKRALDRKHSVVALSRSKIEITNKLLTTIQGDATNKADVAKTIKKADAVLITLGTGKSLKATTLFSDFAKSLVEIQNEIKLGIPFIFVTGFGAGESKNYASFLVRMLLKFMLKDVYSDKTKMEEIITASYMNWIIVRPGNLKDQPLTENYHIENRLYRGVKMGKINRADVADFLIKQAETPTELKKFVTISEK
jgi:putative NADH-flavin reductase